MRSDTTRHFLHIEVTITEEALKVNILGQSVKMDREEVAIHQNSHEQTHPIILFR